MIKIPGLSCYDCWLNPDDRKHRLIDSKQYQELSEGWDVLYDLVRVPDGGTTPRVNHEGGTGSAFHMYIASLIYMTQAKLVYEIGMNVGSASLRILHALKFVEGKLRCFEIDQNKQPVANFLQTKFPDTFSITWGDSQQTVSEITDESPDIIFVDGAHLPNVLRSDLTNAKRLVKPGGFILIDDIDYPGIGQTLRPVIIEILGHNDIIWFNKDAGHTPGLAIYQKREGYDFFPR